MEHAPPVSSPASVGPQAGALAPYRVLDLTGEMGALCPRLMAGMGAEVIRIEPPAGHATRRRGPFLDGVPSPEHGLYWLHMNAGKRAITLNLESADGRALFRRLVARADVVVESLSVGWLDRLGLGYDALAAINPGVILSSISAWGQNGPRAHDPATDLIGMASGGLLFLCGDRDRPPVRVTVEQAYAQAGIQAAVASLVALASRQASGRGLHVDISMQESVSGTLGNNGLLWPGSGVITHRAGGSRAYGDAGSRLIFRAADGYVGFMRRSEHHLLLKRWLADLDIDAGVDLAEWQDRPLYGEGSPPADSVAAVEALLAGYFASQNKRDLQRDAQSRGLILAEVAGPADLVNSPHLAARNYMTEIAYPEFGRTLRTPGAPFIAAATPWRSGRAPRLGEHNLAVYCVELGLSRADLITLKASGAI